MGSFGYGLFWISIVVFVLLTKGDPSILDGWRAQANAQQCPTTDREE